MTARESTIRETSGHTGGGPVTASLPIRTPRRPSRWLSYLFGAFLVGLLVQLLVGNENWQWPVVWSWLFSERVMTGLVNTIVITLAATALGLLIGLVVAVCRLSDLAVMRSVAAAYIWVIRATPGLVLILFVYFFAALVPRLTLGVPGLPPLFDVPTNEVISQFWAAVVGLSVYLGAYSAEIFRGGVLALPRGQFEACHSLGLSTWCTYRKVLGPQIVRVITPSLANEIVTMFKNTSLVSVIGYVELLTTVQLVYSQNFQTIPLLMVAVLWYLVLTSLAMLGQSRLEKRFGRGFERRVITRAATGNAADAQEGNR
jgi:polar amino acid transport system permease protein